MVRRMKGTLTFTGLTHELDERSYAIGKVHGWMRLLNDNMRPIRFYPPTAKGTKVKVEQILDQKDYDKGLEELKAYAEEVNQKHGTDFSFKYENE